MPLTISRPACSPQGRQSNTPVISHPFSLHPVPFLPHPALLSAPPRAVPLLHQLHAHAPALRQPGPQGPASASLGFAQALPAASPSSRTPLGAAANLLFRAGAAAERRRAKAQRKITAEGWQPRAPLWSSSVCLGEARLPSCLAFHSAEERGSCPPPDGLSPAHVCPELSSMLPGRQARAPQTAR